MLTKTAKDKQDFLALPDNERRMALAQDVLDFLAAEKMIAKRGDYVTTGNPLVDHHHISPSEEMVCEALRSEAAACRVCAKGSLLVARIGYQHPLDESCEAEPLLVDLADANTNNAALAGLHADFSEAQLYLMENAFELQTCGGDFLNPQELRNRAYYFGCRHQDTGCRLEAIMRNVLANNGEFVPPAEEGEYDD